MDKIADYLLLRSSYMQELGLFHGKMGVVVALYLYADAYGDEVMREYAWELFQQVYDGVHTDMPVGLERGLAGIGYGTTLLCKRGLVECSLNDILEDIDRKIMERSLLASSSPVTLRLKATIRTWSVCTAAASPSTFGS